MWLIDLGWYQVRKSSFIQAQGIPTNAQGLKLFG